MALLGGIGALSMSNNKISMVVGGKVVSTRVFLAEEVKYVFDYEILIVNKPNCSQNM